MSAPAEPKSLSSRDILARTWRVYLAPRWPGLLLAALAAVVVAALSARLVQILEPAINDLLGKPKPGALLVIPLTIAGLAIGRGLAQVLQATLVNRIGNAVVGDVQVQLFGRLVRADLARLRSQHSGTFVSSVLYDAGLIREAATAGDALPGSRSRRNSASLSCTSRQPTAAMEIRADTATPPG
jgi:subfamily B ATP-binding cassette protein MsbA